MDIVPIINCPYGVRDGTDAFFFFFFLGVVSDVIFVQFQIGSAAKKIIKKYRGLEWKGGGWATKNIIGRRGANKKCVSTLFTPEDNYWNSCDRW